jgi:hypothetical protein
VSKRKDSDASAGPKTVSITTSAATSTTVRRGPFDEHCGDEFLEAADDFSFTLPRHCSTFGFDCDNGAEANAGRSEVRSERLPAENWRGIALTAGSDAA